MGVSGSSLLDENKSTYIKGQAEAVLKEFSLYYRKQFSVAWFSQVEDDLEQQKQKITQLLKQRGASEEDEALYEESILYFDDTRKWRERYVVVRANYCLECHDSLQTFVEGVPAHHKLLPTGGKILTTEEEYMAIVDKCFPDENSAKEDFAPPLSGMPGQFPVYLHLPYRSDSYFCFKQQAKQAAFISILSHCIRHQNLDFLKKKTCEVQAFFKAIQLYRQDKGKYEAWDMMIGGDARVLANVVMEQLLPSLEKDMLPGLKAKKNEKKRVWFSALAAMVRPNLLSCYEKISSLQAKLQHLQERFGFSNIIVVIHSAQIDLQELIENAAYTFEQLLNNAIQDNPDDASSTVEKVKHRVLKQYNHDSSTVRKRIFQEALVSITLPFIKKSLAPTCKTELQDLEQTIYSDHSSFIHVENVYESILLEILDKEVTKVVKEAANLKKHNLFTDKRDLASQSSYSSLSSLPASTPGSPAMTLASLKKSLEPQPLSPLVFNSLPPNPQNQEQEKGKVVLQSETLEDMIMVEPTLRKVEQRAVAPCVPASQETKLKAKDIIQNVSNCNLDSPPLREKMSQSHTQDSRAVVPQIVMQEKVISVETGEAKTAAEPEMKSADTPQEAELPTAVENIIAAAQAEPPEPTNEPANHSAEENILLPAASTEAKTQCETPEIMVEAPPTGEAPGEVRLSEKGRGAEQVAFSVTSPLAVSVVNEPHPSDVESTDDVSTTSDVFEGEANINKLPMCSHDATEDITTSDKLSPPAQTKAESGTVGVGGDIEAGVSVAVEEMDDTTASLFAEPAQEDSPSSPGVRPLDCIKEIRDLVVEVIEVEEPVQHYPMVPKED